MSQNKAKQTNKQQITTTNKTRKLDTKICPNLGGIGKRFYSGMGEESFERNSKNSTPKNKQQMGGKLN